MSGSEDWSWLDDTPGQPDRSKSFGSEPDTGSSPSGSTSAGAFGNQYGADDHFGGDDRFGADDQFGAASAAVSGQGVSAPLSWLFAAGLAAVAAIAVFPLADGRPFVSLAGWVVGGFVAIGLVTVFAYRDSIARTNSWYVIKPQVPIIRAAVLVLATAAVAVNAYLFADWISRR